ncbi:MAG: AraC family transcriptional regulator [Myxococcales bacterium]|nr:MAG: AraC family transcriptional regulator [Myxococcales bacterium]
MSPNGQAASPLVEVASLSCPVAGVLLDYPAGEVIPPHRHDSAQLIYAVSGVMTVHTRAGDWVVPTQRAVWVPAFEEHSIRMTGSVAMRTVYVRAGEAAGLLAECSVVHATDLLRELVLRIVEFSETFRADSSEMRLVSVFFDEIRAAPQIPLHLPMPADPRLRRVTDALTRNPGDQRTLAEWSRVAGASQRTLARLFAAETRMTFGQWCQQARLLSALEHLALGRSVTATALELGYDSPSAFIQMFRRAMGTTPGRYFRAVEP